MGLEGIVFKNNIWLASSILTETYDVIGPAIEAGVGAVVLKSSSNFKRSCGKKCGPCKKEKRTIRLDVITDSKGNIYPISNMDESMGGHNIYSTSTNYQCELLTIDESNRLFDRIKQDHPEIVVVANFAPRQKQDFELIDLLKGDIVEFSSRNYVADFKRPIDLFVYTSDDLLSCCESGYNLAENEKRFREYRNNVLAEFSDQLRHVNRPKLFKFLRQPELGFQEQLALPVDGFTIADSEKSAHYTSKDGVCRLVWGKGSISGQPLFDTTKGYIKLVRNEYHSDKFIAASGGVFSPEDAKAMFNAGANAVQLCSVIFYKGFGAIREIVEKAA